MARRRGRRSPEQLGSVQQERSGRFSAYYRVDGERFAAGHTFATRDEAYAWLAGERTDRHRGTWRDPRIGRDTLEDYAGDWLDGRTDLSPRTRDLYQRLLDRWILPRVTGDTGRSIQLGRIPVAELTTADVRRWHGQLLAATRAAAVDRATTKPAPVHPARAWGKAHGFAVASSGRMSRTLIDAWEAAGAPQPSAPAALDTDTREAGRTTAAQAYRLLHTILATAVEDKLLAANPCRIRGAGAVRHAERPTATAEEIDALAAVFPERLRAAVILAAWSGLRYGELFALARQHVDLAAGTVKVERALVLVPGQRPKLGPTKTAHSRRVVNLPGFVVDELRRHLAAYVPIHPTALLFTVERTGNPITSDRLAKTMKRARAAIGRPDLHWHDLRHTGALFAYRAGGTVKDVQRRLGHSTVRAAMTYAHTAQDADQVLAARLDELRRADAVAALPADQADVAE